MWPARIGRNKQTSFLFWLINKDVVLSNANSFSAQGKYSMCFVFYLHIQTD